MWQLETIVGPAAIKGQDSEHIVIGTTLAARLDWRRSFVEIRLSSIAVAVCTPLRLPGRD